MYLLNQLAAEAACIVSKGSIEEKIYQRQISKSGLAEVMEAGAGSAQATVRFSSEELKVHLQCIYIVQIIRIMLAKDKEAPI